ncbi:hypothetical protein THF1C08_20035 [Vibrio jasicida]|uniref:Uncharacterized protein n=1 Tax=Vibrio jasicida TaxID=766224 RepID=A0AAU9QJG2_9VIBR|nr:hypothetical protein THF1C08_20035 [Vibrio jasicida]CAH1584039.1 hypothetical protein THF1A12_20035 [Vibrio jasicida]
MLAFLIPYFVKLRANFKVDDRYSVDLQTQQNTTTAQNHDQTHSTHQI